MSTGLTNPSERTLDEDDQPEVEEALQFLHGKWPMIGTQLHLRQNIMQTITSQHLDPAESMKKVVENYLQKNYNVERFGLPTWKKIVEAVEKPAGGGNVAEAERIAKEFASNVKIKSSYSRSGPVALMETSVNNLPEPVVQPYTTTSASYFPVADGSKVQVDGPNSKIAFERFTQWSPEEKQKEVKLSFGAVKPLEGLKNVSVASSYDMKKWPHGICMIINNEQFTKHPGREGTNIDECNIVQTFRHLGYVVEVHRDCTSDKIQELFEEIRKRDHTGFDSFICCIMSHGEAGHIIGSDSTKVLLENVAAQLSGEKCKTLASKPKLFFMQACRGLQKDRAVRVEEDSGVPMDVQEHKVASDSSSRVATDSGETIPDAADFFFSYATPMNQVAWRDMDNGSWYVSELCKSLTSYGVYSSLVDMVTRTNGDVAQGYSFRGFKQEPDFNSRLRKDVFFF